MFPVKDLNYKYRYSSTQYTIASNRKSPIKHFSIFGCPAIFKRYVMNDTGKIMKKKYTQQGVRDIFVGIPNDSAGWIFLCTRCNKDIHIFGCYF